MKVKDYTKIYSIFLAGYRSVSDAQTIMKFIKKFYGETNKQIRIGACYFILAWVQEYFMVDFWKLDVPSMSTSRKHKKEKEKEKK